MSHTFYDSPDEQPDPRLSIDVTQDYVWFFGHEGEETAHVRIRREELPSVARAINAYLAYEAELAEPARFPCVVCGLLLAVGPGAPCDGCLGA